jgi:hypothetical protein
MSDQLVSTGTAITIVVGMVIGYAYLRFMWGSLQNAVQTRDETDGSQDRYHFSLIGAVISVVASSAAIASYGLGPPFLYVGPLLALASAVAVTYCLRTEYIGK